MLVCESSLLKGYWAPVKEVEQGPFPITQVTSVIHLLTPQLEVVRGWEAVN